MDAMRRSRNARTEPKNRRTQLRRPGPALVLATLALFVALSGGAVAAGIVPMARHAYTADSAALAVNAKHLGGKTAAQIEASIKRQSGPAGVAGPAGPAGPVGPAGPSGPAGSKGDTGASGAVGPAGPSGPAGPAGSKGDTGASGAVGPQGDPGTGLKIVGTAATPAGLPSSGTTGDGYLVAGNLYVWTGSTWTNAGPVQGPKGDKGDTGSTGATGPQGPEGSQGPAGTAAVTIHTAPYSLAAGDTKAFTTDCASGQKAVGGGFDSDGSVFNFDTTPTAADDGWVIVLANPDSKADTGLTYTICLG
jgi:hypothetical protein